VAKILIVGGGFGGVVAAESLARKVEGEHQVVLVSRSRNFFSLQRWSGSHSGEASRTTFHSICARPCSTGA